MNEISKYFQENGCSLINFDMDPNYHPDDRDYLEIQIDKSELYNRELPFVSYVKNYNNENLEKYVGTPEYNGLHVLVHLHNEDIVIYDIHHNKINKYLHKSLEEQLIVLSIALGEKNHIVEGYFIDCYEQTKFIITDLHIKENIHLGNSTFLARHLFLQYLLEIHMTVAAAWQGTVNDIWLCPLWIHDIERQFLQIVSFPDVKGLLFRNNNQILDNEETILRYFQK